MTLITRYVLKQLFVGMVLVTAGLTCVIWLTQSLRFVEMIVNRGLTAGTFLHLTMLLLPNFLSLILPIALFTVVLFTYNKLIADRELAVMRAAGLSQTALAMPALVLGGAVVVVSYAINLHLLPESYRMFREMQWDIRYNYSHVLLQEGTFNPVAQDITVYVRKRGHDSQLHGVLVHDTRDAAKPVTMMAERGALVEAEGKSRVVMFNGNRQEVERSANRFSILYFDRYSFDIEAARKTDIVRYREPRERTLGELFDIAQDPHTPPRDWGKYIVEGHKRLASPLASLGFALIGLACMIHGNFSRRQQTQRIVLAVVIVVVLQASTLGIENVAARNTKLAPLLYAIAVLPILAGYIAMLAPPRRPTPEADDAAATAPS
ncbi:MAG: LPS export ABC transporter permease LptF [Magnetospirillum sp. WYHS-4]